MKIVAKWDKQLMEYDYILCKEVPTKFDREHICMSIGIDCVSEEQAYEILGKLEMKINDELGNEYGIAHFDRCSSYGEFKYGSLYDNISWKREYGNVSEQRKIIMQAVKKIIEGLV